IAACDTFVLLALQKRGVRIIEVVTLVLVAIIAGSFACEIVLARPDWGQVVRGFAPGLPANALAQGLYVAIGMLGATVMPHNLSRPRALVQPRAIAPSDQGKEFACRYNLFDSALALNCAFFINSAILVLAAAAFFGRPEELKTLQDAHKLLEI